LPATVIYLVWLVVTVSSGQSPLPIISIVLIASVYGLQALIFIVKREFMLVGWMVVYLISYPIYSFFLPLYSFWRMDDFGWGNTRVVLDDGKNKKVITDGNEIKFNESMIPYKKWSEYEAEVYGDGVSNNSLSAEQNPPNPKDVAAPVPRHPNSQRPSVYEYQSEAGDYFRNTNAVQDPLRGPPSRPSSRAMSDYNRATANQRHSTFRSPSQERLAIGTPVNQFATLPDPRMTMNSAIMNRSLSPAHNVRPTSTFSLATTVFAGPSNNPNPSDDELYESLRKYLSTQDLMTVTKKTARDAMAARYPRADLTPRKDFLNQSIDNILSHS